MAVTEPVKIYKLPQSKYIDSLRWLPTLSAFDRLYALAVFDFDTNTPSLEIHTISKSNPQNPKLHSTWLCPSLISSLRVSNSLIVAATYGGSLNFLFRDSAEGLVESGRENEPHTGGIASVDLVEGECVSVGEDGRVNVVRVREVDQRKPGGPVFKFKANWVHGGNSGIVHSVDIHPSRKHTCLAGGSAGTIFAWDLRWPQQQIFLSGVGMNESTTHPPCESEEPIELLAEPCAINGFDIDKQNPSHFENSSFLGDTKPAVAQNVICSLEWESVAILVRP
ncbi:hypothetical protein RJ641_025413 [Dillenia turbinata]|uniref:Uncharacterized protein n=1 Tax=Dillenia turbinata TaxID=194707 RepID=A0AAN8ZNI7_9MAGN